MPVVVLARRYKFRISFPHARNGNFFSRVISGTRTLRRCFKVFTYGLPAKGSEKIDSSTIHAADTYTLLDSFVFKQTGCSCSSKMGMRRVELCFWKWSWRYSYIQSDFYNSGFWHVSLATTADYLQLEQLAFSWRPRRECLKSGRSRTYSNWSLARGLAQLRRKYAITDIFRAAMLTMMQSFWSNTVSNYVASTLSSWMRSPKLSLK